MYRPRIGVFDSGVGGLSVLRRLIERLPNAVYHYFGDTARVPYGTRSQHTIVEFTSEGLSYLRSLDVDLVVVACNTASAVAVPVLVEQFCVPLIGVVEDGVEAAAEGAKSGVLVLATRATIESGVYQRGIAERRPDLDVKGLACPLFVPLVEEGWSDTVVAEAAARRYLTDVERTFDYLLLGCTHFPAMRNTLKRVLGQDIRIEDPSDRVAARVASLLPSALEGPAPAVHFHVTDAPGSLVRIAQIMGVPVSASITEVDVALLAPRALPEPACDIEK